MAKAQISQDFRPQRHQLLIGVVVFALFVGLVLLLLTHAAGPFVSIEPETSTLSGSVQMVNDSTASGAKAVAFGVLTPPPPVGPPPPPVPPGAPCGSSAHPPAAWKHIIIVVYENQAQSSIIGNSAAPYANQLAGQCGRTSNWQNSIHPSLGNYLAFTFGDNFGVTDDQNPPSHVQTSDNIFRQVLAAGKTTKSYQESMTSSCLLSDSGGYKVHHNGWAYATGGNDRSTCGQFDIPMGSNTSGTFINDLNNDTLPLLSFVEPNNSHNTHDNSVATGDAWAQTLLTNIFASPSYRRGEDVVFWIWDESAGGSPLQPGLVASAATVPGTVFSPSTNHYGFVRTLDEMMGLPLLNKASTGTSMKAGFNL